MNKIVILVLLAIMLLAGFWLKVDEMIQRLDRLNKRIESLGVTMSAQDIQDSQAVVNYGKPIEKVTLGVLCVLVLIWAVFAPIQYKTIHGVSQQQTPAISKPKNSLPVSPLPPAHVTSQPPATR